MRLAIETVISGGQTGVDRAALDTAFLLNISCGGWCPKGRRAEDGRIPNKYPLRETPSEHYAQRTEWNVLSSDGTLILTCGDLIGGTAYTAQIAELTEKPLLILELSADTDTHAFFEWICNHEIQKLNIAGLRESQSLGIYDRTTRYLFALLRA